MTKTVVIHQPDFIPYLGFFHRFLNADLFVVQDAVQFSKRGWTHRDKIKTQAGATWLSLHLRKHSHTTPINEILLSDSTCWREEHLKALTESYKRAPFFEEIYLPLRNTYENISPEMSVFNMKIIELLMDFFDVRLPYVYASKLKASGSSNELLIAQLKEVEATHYLSGIGARDYMQLNKFAQAGIEVIWQQFTHPVYPQKFGAFLPDLSSLDLLFNCGIAASRKILRETL